MCCVVHYVICDYILYRVSVVVFIHNLVLYTLIILYRYLVL